jgi:hypothetical protein
MSWQALAELITLEAAMTDALQQIEDEVTQAGQFEIDRQEINDNGGFTVVFAGPDGRDICTAGVFVTEGTDPKVVVAVNPLHAASLILGNSRRNHVAVQIQTLGFGATHVIECQKVKNGRDVEILWYETDLSEFTSSLPVNRCVWFITSVFKHALMEQNNANNTQVVG